MKLTGKAKEDFLKYYKSGEYFFENVLDEKYQYAEIIEWFDSVGIYIDTNNQHNDNGELTVQSNLYVNGEYIGYESCDSRQEATQQAIIKANEIYNNQNK